MLTRCVKTYSSSCLQIAIVYLQPLRRNSLVKCTAQPNVGKNNETHYFWNSGSFKIIDVE